MAISEAAQGNHDAMFADQHSTSDDCGSGALLENEGAERRRRRVLRLEEKVAALDAKLA